MFENLNVGDNIAVVTAYTLTKTVFIGTVSKTTPTQIHVGSENRFSRSSGVAIGHNRRSSEKYLVPLYNYIVFDFFARKIADRVAHGLTCHDSSFAGRDGILRSLKEMRAQLDKAIDLIEDDERLIEFGINN